MQFFMIEGKKELIEIWLAPYDLPHCQRILVSFTDLTSMGRLNLVLIYL